MVKGVYVRGSKMGQVRRLVHIRHMGPDILHKHLLEVRHREPNSRLPGSQMNCLEKHRIHGVKASPVLCGSADTSGTEMYTL